MFFPGTNVTATNQCRRSSTAYPYLVAEQLGMGLDFFARSGATSADIYDKAQMRDSPADVVGGLPQLDSPFDPSRVSVVLLSIGGNDAKFGKIGIACAMPSLARCLRQNWLANVSHIGPDITRPSKQIKEAVGEATPIVVVPYPLMINAQRCAGSALSVSEHQFLSEFVALMDDRVRHSAAEVGLNFFTPGLFAFTGRQICDTSADGSVMNFFNLHPQQGSLMDDVNPKNWVHGTFHPKPSGHQAIADLLAPWLKDFLADVDAGTMPANPEPGDTAFTIKPSSTLVTSLVDPRTIPESPECPEARIDSFATLLPALDARMLSG